MLIVKPSVELVHATPDPEMVVERFGRIAYQSFQKQRPCPNCAGVARRATVLESATCPRCRGWGTDPGTAFELVAHLLKLGHMSVFEHVCLGVSIVTDRGVTHEAVRHRTGIAFTQESTRYCGFDGERFGGQIRVVEPPGLENFGDRVPRAVITSDGVEASGTRSEAQVEWIEAMEDAEAHYMKLLGLGVAAQIARSVLPTGLKSEIGITANANEWHHVLTLRLSPKAHPQMVEVMQMALPHLVDWLPAVFGKFLPAVEVPGAEPAARRTRDGRRVPAEMEGVECQCADGEFRPAVATYVGERFMRLAVEAGDDGELWQVEVESEGWRWPKDAGEGK